MTAPELSNTTTGRLTLDDVDKLDAPLGAIADYASMIRLIAETLKKYDSDTEAALERIGWNLTASVEQIRELRDRLCKEG